MIFVFGIVLSHVFALPVATVYKNKLQAAKSKAEVFQIKEEFTRIEMLNRSCGMQLSTTELPTRCYEWLELLGRWNAINQLERLRQTQKFDRACRKWSKHALTGQYDEPVSALSPECRRFVTHVREIRTYREEE